MSLHKRVPIAEALAGLLTASPAVEVSNTASAADVKPMTGSLTTGITAGSNAGLDAGISAAIAATMPGPSIISTRAMSDGSAKSDADLRATEAKARFLAKVTITVQDVHSIGELTLIALSCVAPRLNLKQKQRLR